jgi:hypothetical protein
VADEIIQRFDVQGEGRMVFKVSADSATFRKRIAEMFPDGQYAVEIGSV